MELNYNGGEIDQQGFAGSMATNCNGSENHHQEVHETPKVDEEAPPSYADAFPPLPTTPNEPGTSSVQATKWGKMGKKTGKAEPKNIAKPLTSNVTQVGLLIMKLHSNEFDEDIYVPY